MWIGRESLTSLSLCCSAATLSAAVLSSDQDAVARVRHQGLQQHTTLSARNAHLKHTHTHTRTHTHHTCTHTRTQPHTHEHSHRHTHTRTSRSEERRGAKECRSTWSPYH